MTRIILASHHRMAEGLLDTLNYILPEHVPVHALCAYLDNRPVEETFAQVLQNVPEDEQILILTDMMGGSVNQYCCRLFGKYPNLHVIAGMSLPLALTLALQASAGELTSEAIARCVEDCRNQVIYVNEALQGSDDGEDE